MTRKTIRRGWWLALLLLVGLVEAAAAQVWTEVGDAGDLPATAQVTTTAGLVEIHGTLAAGGDDVDMYCIQMVDPQQFVALFNCTTQDAPDLWLFTSDAMGNYGMDGCYSGVVAVALGNGASLWYYLAISRDGFEAIGDQGSLWDPTAPGPGRSPDGPGAGGPLVSWQAPVNPQGGDIDYVIHLDWADACDQSVADEPLSWSGLRRRYH